MIIFRDIEKDIYSTLHAAFPSVRVATKKAPANEQPATQIVITASYGNEKSVSPVLRYAGVVIDVYGDDYDTVSTLALQVAARLQTVTGTYVKKVSLTSGPVRMGSDTGQEHRAISAEVTVKATNYNP
jgi:hypothetical protein